MFVKLCVCVCVFEFLCQGGEGIINGRPATSVWCFPRGEEELGGIAACLSSILPVTTATPLREGKGVYGRAETCEVWTWIGGKPRQKGEKEGMKRMTGDKQGRAGEKCRGRVDNEESERWQEGWQVIVAEGVTGSRRQTEERMRKCIDILCRTVSSHLKGGLWLQTLPFTLTLSTAFSILCLPPVDASTTTEN